MIFLDLQVFCFQNWNAFSLKNFQNKLLWFVLGIQNVIGRRIHKKLNIVVSCLYYYFFFSPPTFFLLSASLGPISHFLKRSNKKNKNVHQTLPPLVSLHCKFLALRLAKSATRKDCPQYRNLILSNCASEDHFTKFSREFCDLLEVFRKNYLRFHSGSGIRNYIAQLPIIAIVSDIALFRTVLPIPTV